ncbi:hypothetical protein [Pacificoceanicola onchidii]|uniref:hypothetical protein n=1 Tax=Pacificoceanicola onchidii TaxID=2562685 RepID=UPI0010A5B0E0|nr:hypothetical protein [Pacificoceanicola onchidii]
MTRPFALLAVLLLAPASGATAQVLEASSDATIRRSLCLGQLCPDNPTGSFSLDAAGGATLRLHDGNTRIDFDDSTTNPSFPQNKWSLVANDTAPSGADYFAIEDVTGGGVRPFVVEAGAPANGLYVADDGKIGLGTMLPQENLHIIGGGTFGNVGIRFEDATDFPYIWDMQGTSIGFFLRDVTGSETPFFVGPGAPGNSLMVGSSGRVGVGASSPAAALHVEREDGSASILVENTGGNAGVPREMFKMASNGGSYFTLENSGSGTAWYFVHENAAPNRFIISDAVADGPEMSLTADGDLTVPGTFISGSTTLNVPDYVFEPGYDLRPLSEVSAFIDQNGHLPEVPSAAQIAKDGLDMTDMQMRLLKKVEELTLYTLAQEAELTRLRALEARLEALEALEAR